MTYYVAQKWNELKLQSGENLKNKMLNEKKQISEEYT